MIRTYTQEDPIGLAGGLNLYGFAGGDPINFSDPFGLCPKEMQDNAEECDAWNQNQAREAVEFFEAQRAQGNPGTRFATSSLPAVRGVNAGDIMLASNCGVAQEQTATACTRIRGSDVAIVVNADRPIEAIAASLAHENVHAAGAGMEWEGYAQAAAYTFVRNLPLAAQVTALAAGAGPYPTRPVIPLFLFRP